MKGAAGVTHRPKSCRGSAQCWSRAARSCRQTWVSVEEGTVNDLAAPKFTEGHEYCAEYVVTRPYSGEGWPQVITTIAALAPWRQLRRQALPCGQLVGSTSLPPPPANDLNHSRSSTESQLRPPSHSSSSTSPTSVPPSYILARSLPTHSNQDNPLPLLIPPLHECPHRLSLGLESGRRLLGVEVRLGAELAAWG